MHTINYIMHTAVYIYSQVFLYPFRQQYHFYVKIFLSPACIYFSLHCIIDKNTILLYGMENGHARFFIEKLLVLMFLV